MKPIDFSKNSLDDSKNSYERINNIISELKDDGKTNEKYIAEFEKAVNDDLNTPQALAVLWRLLRDKKAGGKITVIRKMDEVLGLDLGKTKKTEIPDEIKKTVDRREQMRKEKKWQEADKIRQELEKMGWMVKDNNIGTEVMKIKEC